jgi:trypsin
LELADAFPANSTITYAVLPASGSDPVAGVITTTAGWGLTSEDDTTIPTDLLKVDVPVVSRSSCNASIGFRAPITPQMFCAGFPEGGKDSCNGDSGGPIVDCSTKALLGVVSWGLGCANPDAPGVYASIGEVALNSWIVENL